MSRCKCEHTLGEAVTGLNIGTVSNNEVLAVKRQIAALIDMLDPVDPSDNAAFGALARAHVDTCAAFGWQV